MNLQGSPVRASGKGRNCMAWMRVPQGIRAASTRCWPRARTWSQSAGRWRPPLVVDLTPSVSCRRSAGRPRFSASVSTTAPTAWRQASETPDYPAVFARFASSLVGHGQPRSSSHRCPTSSITRRELVAVIGRRCKGVSKADALACVAGYSIFNEASIRDYQMRTSQWTMGKNFDATGAFGPWLSTPDELPAGAFRPLDTDAAQRRRSCRTARPPTWCSASPISWPS